MALILSNMNKFGLIYDRGELVWPKTACLSTAALRTLNEVM